MEFPGEKLVIKLWETLTEKGVGSLLTPWQIVHEGTARNKVRREELLMLAQAEVEAAEIRVGRKCFELDGTLRPLLQLPPADSAEDEPTRDVRSLAESSARFSIAEDIRREVNVNKAIIHAEEVLANDPQTPPEKSIEEDWLFAWRDYAGRVSVEDLQQLWGKVLAGEIKSPGRFSLRTLEFLKGLSRDEAEQISKLASFVVEDVIIRDLQPSLIVPGGSLGPLLAMEDLGILSGVQSGGLTMNTGSALPERFVRVLRSNGKCLVVEHDDQNKQLSLPVYKLTAVCRQLLSLGSFEPNLDYLRLAGKEIVKQGFTVRLATWVQLTEDKGRYDNPEAIDA